MDERAKDVNAGLERTRKQVSDLTTRHGTSKETRPKEEDVRRATQVYLAWKAAAELVSKTDGDITAEDMDACVDGLSSLGAGPEAEAIRYVLRGGPPTPRRLLMLPEKP